MGVTVTKKKMEDSGKEDDAPTSIPTLDVATMEEIWTEIKARYSGAILAIHRATQDATENADEMKILYHGGCILALGLATAAKLDMTQRFLGTEPREL